MNTFKQQLQLFNTEDNNSHDPALLHNFIKLQF